MVAPEPLTPRARVRDNQFAVLTADPVLLASLGGPRVVHELSSLAWASVLSPGAALGGAIVAVRPDGRARLSRGRAAQWSTLSCASFSAAGRSGDVARRRGSLCPFLRRFRRRGARPLGSRPLGRGRLFPGAGDRVGALADTLEQPPGFEPTASVAAIVASGVLPFRPEQRPDSITRFAISFVC